MYLRIKLLVHMEFHFSNILDDRLFLTAFLPTFFSPLSVKELQCSIWSKKINIANFLFNFANYVYIKYLTVVELKYILVCISFEI